MKISTLGSFLVMLAAVTNAETLWREEVLSGVKNNDQDNRQHASSSAIFDRFELTHEWEGAGQIRVKIWEAPGMWPGKFPVLAQVWNANGKLLAAEELELQAARPIKFWAFKIRGSDLVINIECQHRDNSENGTYAFRVDMANRLAQGGPVIGLAVITASGRVVSDLVTTTHSTSNGAEPAGAGQPATKPTDKDPAKFQPSTPTSKVAPR